jgi:hypothetical protein
LYHMQKMTLKLICLFEIDDGTSNNVNFIDKR